MSSREVPSNGTGGRPDPRVAIVGTGVSGICLAALMKQAGFHSFTVFEKSDDVGGTWRDNRYPGLTCDIASRCYSFSFAPNPDWSQVFAPGAEIHEYLRRVVDNLDIRRHVRFGTEVIGAEWTGTEWIVTDQSGEETAFDFVVSAVGILHYPNIPSIPGIDSFSGDIFHSAQWEDVPLEGRRVAVIGTGSSGVQIVSAIADEVGEVSHFARTPQWILPMLNPSYSRVTRQLMRRVPKLNDLAYRNYLSFHETTAKAAVAPGWHRNLVGRLCRLHLRRIRDRKLRAELTPDYPPGCKRIVVSGSYYRAVQKPNVSLVSSAIEGIEPTGIRTVDGRLRKFDVIVLATGFEFFRPMPNVIGEDGRKLEETWTGRPKNYLTVAVAGFPNFFMVNGPPLAFTSICAAAETQAGYVIRWLEMFRSQMVANAVVRQSAQDLFDEELRERLPLTTFAAGCDSYYLSDDGLPVVLPMTFSELRARLSEIDLRDFEVRAAV